MYADCHTASLPPRREGRSRTLLPKLSFRESLEPPRKERNSKFVQSSVHFFRLSSSPLAQVVIAIPEVPGFSGDVKDQSSLKIIMAAQYRTMNRGGSSIYEAIRKAGFEP